MYKIDHPFFLKYICEPACDELLQPGSGHTREAAWPGARPRRWLFPRIALRRQRRRDLALP